MFLYHVLWDNNVHLKLIEKNDFLSNGSHPCVTAELFESTV